MEHSYFNLMLYLFQEDCKQPEGYKVGLLNIHMIQDKTIQRLSHTHNSKEVMIYLWMITYKKTCSYISVCI
jgi:hypothetical protein